MKHVLITHVNEYTGPGALKALLKDNILPVCHDRSFTDQESAQSFEQAHPGAVVLKSQAPEEIHAELKQSGIEIAAVISNDVFPNTPCPIEEVELGTLQESFAALLLFPFRLSQLLLPDMKKRNEGCFVFVTSARYLQPESGFSVATAVRAGTTAFALALAREAAPFGIQVNVLAPNYLYSEAYYPRARFIDDPEGRKEIAEKVPVGRLGTPEEVGELLLFMVSGRSKFMTGEVINFTGCWP